jgi:hypothetical protein
MNEIASQNFTTPRPDFLTAIVTFNNGKTREGTYLGILPAISVTDNLAHRTGSLNYTHASTHTHAHTARHRDINMYCLIHIKIRLFLCLIYHQALKACRAEWRYISTILGPCTRWR